MTLATLLAATYCFAAGPCARVEMLNNLSCFFLVFLSLALLRCTLSFATDSSSGMTAWRRAFKHSTR